MSFCVAAMRKPSVLRITGKFTCSPGAPLTVPPNRSSTVGTGVGVGVKGGGTVHTNVPRAGSSRHSNPWLQSEFLLQFPPTSFAGVQNRSCPKMSHRSGPHSRSSQQTPSVQKAGSHCSERLHRLIGTFVGDGVGPNVGVA